MVRIPQLQLLHHNLPTLQVKVRLNLNHSRRMPLLRVRLIKNLKEERHPKLIDVVELEVQKQPQKQVQTHQLVRMPLQKVAHL